MDIRGKRTQERKLSATSPEPEQRGREDMEKRSPIVGANPPYTVLPRAGRAVRCTQGVAPTPGRKCTKSKAEQKSSKNNKDSLEVGKPRTNQ